MAHNDGVYGLTLEKMFIDTAGQSMEAETHNLLLVTNSETPDFDAHDFRADVTGETSGTGYTSGGTNLTTTEITLAAGILTYDAADTVFTTVSVTARGTVIFFDTGNAATDMLILAQLFSGDVTSTAANFTVAHNASGIMTLDYVP